MELNELTFASAQPVDGYGPGFFRVGGEVIEGAAFLLPERARRWDGDSAAIVAAAGEMDVLLLGMGADVAVPDDDFVAAIEAAGIGVEIMSSPSACRTYNVLLSEGRRIGAALHPVTE
ncbi:Mth938-like domain-containing protein [Roseobacter sp. HKCCA0434]|uniref:Mth938-like domain-containing protein n=1 Tax=Roseobacter sp. HKCCA0434 TaxID=3079297 RepID=UPI002905898B|nr:Mth938-like domain-containing protein [Roseobacter sp. HKCCA0434]